MADLKRRHEAEKQQIEGLMGLSSLRTALGFSVLGLLAALFLAPVLESGTQSLAWFANGGSNSPIDQTVTGSVDETGGTRTYIIRRSVMQKDPTRPCIVYQDGTTEPDC